MRVAAVSTRAGAECGSHPRMCFGFQALYAFINGSAAQASPKAAIIRAVLDAVGLHCPSQLRNAFCPIKTIEGRPAARIREQDRLFAGHKHLGSHDMFDVLLAQFFGIATSRASPVQAQNGLISFLGISHYGQSRCRAVILQYQAGV
jgi:hypothetical protein